MSVKTVFPSPASCETCGACFYSVKVGGRNREEVIVFEKMVVNKQERERSSNNDE